MGGHRAGCQCRVQAVGGRAPLQTDSQHAAATGAGSLRGTGEQRVGSGCRQAEGRGATQKIPSGRAAKRDLVAQMDKFL